MALWRKVGDQCWCGSAHRVMDCGGNAKKMSSSSSSSAWCLVFQPVTGFHPFNCSGSSQSEQFPTHAESKAAFRLQANLIPISFLPASACFFTVDSLRCLEDLHCSDVVTDCLSLLLSARLQLRTWYGGHLVAPYQVWPSGSCLMDFFRILFVSVNEVMVLLPTRRVSQGLRASLPLLFHVSLLLDRWSSREPAGVGRPAGTRSTLSQGDECSRCSEV